MPYECPPARTDQTVLELLFDSAAMVVVGRLLVVVAACVLLACAIFVLASAAVRMRNGHWLRRAGPFEVSESVAGDVDRRILGLEEIVVAQQVEIAKLQGLMLTGQQVIANLHEKEGRGG